MTQKPQPTDLAAPGDLYLPARAASVALAQFEQIGRAATHLTWGIDYLDDYLNPMVGGDLISIIGRPGHGKTSLTIHLARHAETILKPHGQYVLVATYETLIEEYVAIANAHISGQPLEAIGRGVADLDRIISTLAAGMDGHIAVIGKSKQSHKEKVGAGTDLFDQKLVASWRLPTVLQLAAILHWMNANNYPVGLMIVDFLQRIPALKTGRDRSLEVSENLEWLKDMAIHFDIPIVVPVQAKRDVDAYKGLRLPTMSDGLWTSTIEHSSDKVLTVSKPGNFLEAGTLLDDQNTNIFPQGEYTVTGDEVAMFVPKQRWGNAGRTFMLGMRWETMEMHAAKPTPRAF